MDLHSEVVELTRDLVRLDTSNSLGVYPGNETLVARHLADYLGDAGIECELVAREGNEHRANLVARVPGQRSRYGAEPGVRGPHRRRARRRPRLDPPAVRGRAHRRRLPVGPRHGRHEGRGGRACGRAQGAGPLGLAAAGRPVVPRRRRRGGRHGRGRDELAPPGPSRHPARHERQRGRRRAVRAHRRPHPGQRRSRREGHVPGPGHRGGRGRPRQPADPGRQRGPAPGRADRPHRPRPARTGRAPSRRPDARGAAR